MFTIFTIPRPFVGHFDVIQRNAIRSWQLLKPAPEILLFGEGEPGAEEAARDLGVPLLPVARSSRGKPLITDALRRAQEMAAHDILVMVNADNIYMSDLPPAVEFVAGQFEDFLMIGRRWNLDFEEKLVFEDGWEDDVRRRVRERGSMFHIRAMDYFVFRGDFWRGLPDLAVGQGWYDWLLVWLAIRASVPTVDATKAVMVVHQNHDYASYNKFEAARNIELIIDMYGLDKWFTDRDFTGIMLCDWKLFPDHLMEKSTGREIFWKKGG